MRVAMARRMVLATTLLLIVGLVSACTIGPAGAGSGGPTAIPGTAPLPGASRTPDASTGAFWQDTVNFAGTGPEPRPVQVRVYPLQRLRDRVLLTVDLTSAFSTATFDPFCTGTACGDLRGVSLIDTTARTRFGPLRSDQGGPMMTSSTTGLALQAGMTYRFGALFADPGVSTVVVDLQQAGLVTGVPVVTTFPVANLISTQGPGLVRWNPAPVTVGTTVTAPVPALTGRFDANRHPLTAKIVGGTVNDSPGMVTISSDAIFQNGTTTFSTRGPGRIQRAAELLAARADPAQPIAIVGYTDAAGSTGRSAGLARAVRTELADRLKQYTLTVGGRGNADPVAAATTSLGQPSPSGRALNRRIEVSYAPKAAVQGALATSPDLSVVPGPSVTARPGTPADAGQALVKAGPAQIDPRSKARITAAVTRVQVDGGMTVVSLLIRSDRHASLVGAFSTRTGRRTNLSAFHLIDPATGQVFVPAYDTGNPDRVTGTFAYRFESGTRYALSFLTTALPASLTTVDVALAGIGTARMVPVER